jgi:hypothetical protein
LIAPPPAPPSLTTRMIGFFTVASSSGATDLSWPTFPMAIIVIFNEGGAGGGRLKKHKTSYKKNKK